jgi:hypothetical protein
MRDPKDSIWWRLINLQPATWRGLVVAVIGFLAALGFIVKPEIPEAFLGVVAILLPIVQALWTKSAVTPNAKVAIRIDDPISKPAEITAGEAQVSTAVRPLEIIEAATEKGA